MELVGKNVFSFLNSAVDCNGVRATLLRKHKAKSRQIASTNDNIRHVRPILPTDVVHLVHPSAASLAGLAFLTEQTLTDQSPYANDFFIQLQNIVEVFEQYALLSILLIDGYILNYIRKQYKQQSHFWKQQQQQKQQHHNQNTHHQSQENQQFYNEHDYQHCKASFVDDIVRWILNDVVNKTDVLVFVSKLSVLFRQSLIYDTIFGYVPLQCNTLLNSVPLHVAFTDRHNAHDIVVYSMRTYIRNAELLVDSMKPVAYNEFTQSYILTHNNGETRCSSLNDSKVHDDDSTQKTVLYKFTDKLSLGNIYPRTCFLNILQDELQWGYAQRVHQRLTVENMTKTRILVSSALHTAIEKIVTAASATTKAATHQQSPALTNIGVEVGADTNLSIRQRDIDVNKKEMEKLRSKVLDLEHSLDRKTIHKQSLLLDNSSAAELAEVQCMADYQSSRMLPSTIRMARQQSFNNGIGKSALLQISMSEKERKEQETIRALQTHIDRLKKIELDYKRLNGDNEYLEAKFAATKMKLDIVEQDKQALQQAARQAEHKLEEKRKIIEKLNTTINELIDASSADDADRQKLLDSFRRLGALSRQGNKGSRQPDLLRTVDYMHIEEFITELTSQMHTQNTKLKVIPYLNSEELATICDDNTKKKRSSKNDRRSFSAYESMLEELGVFPIPIHSSCDIHTQSILASYNSTIKYSWMHDKERPALNDWCQKSKSAKTTSTNTNTTINKQSEQQHQASLVDTPGLSVIDVNPIDEEDEDFIRQQLAAQNTETTFPKLFERRYLNGQFPSQSNIEANINRRLGEKWTAFLERQFLITNRSMSAQFTAHGQKIKPHVTYATIKKYIEPFFKLYFPIDLLSDLRLGEIIINNYIDLLTSDMKTPESNDRLYNVLRYFVSNVLA